MTTRSGSRTFWAVVGLVGAGLFGALPAHASFTFTVVSSIATPNSNGNSFDVILTNAGGAAQNIAAFNFQISVTNADISFDAANTNESTVSPYLFFPGDSFDVNNGFPLASLSGAQILLASDLSDSGAGTSVGALATVGLAHVLYNVANNATPGNFTVTLAPASPQTSLSDNLGNPAAFTTVNGTISILGSVPEPSTLLLTLTAGGFLLAGKSKRIARRFYPGVPKSQ